MIKNISIDYYFKSNDSIIIILRKTGLNEK
mgnify:CR=1 FL=1|jgi:hypothetical protein